MIGDRSSLARYLFEKALERPPGERFAFLDEACGDDHDLRMQLDELLQAHQDAGDFLEPVLERPSETRVDLAGAMVGKQIGRYSIRRMIAAGGMGTVYEAIQDQPRRIVALKLMKQGIASRSALRRFEYESQILGRLRHPGIAQVYEAGMHREESGGEVPYFVMEYIPNAVPLTDYARQNKLSSRQRLELFTQVCDAVHHGHQKGIIHRDIKPGNILVDSTARPKIIDYGVARATDSDMAVTTLQTGVGQMIGTLQYMSPEQCLADPHDLDIRSDVYALGVVMYEVLLERLPYDLSRMAIHEAARQIREQSPIRPSTINRMMRGDVETIVLKALEKDRSRRYRSAADLGDDIRRYLNQEPISARPASFAYQFRMFARRNRTIVRSAAALFVVLVGGVVATSVQWARAQRISVEKTKLADSTVRMFAQSMGHAIVEAERTGQKEIAGRLIAAAERDLEEFETFANEPELKRLIMAVRASALRRIGDLEAAEALMVRSHEMIRRAVGENHPSTIQAKGALAGLYRAKPDYAGAEQFYRVIFDVERSRRADEIDPSLWHEFADMLHDLGRCAEAEDILRTTIEVMTQQGRDVVYYETDLAGVWRSQGRLSEAEGLLITTVDKRVRVGTSPGDTVLHRAQRELARLYLTTGRLKEAELLQRQALEGLNRDPEMLEHELDKLLCTEVRGLIEFAQGRFEQAFATFESVAALADRAVGWDTKWFAAHFRADQAKCLIRLQRFAEAEALLQDAYRVLRLHLSDEHHRTQECMRTLAELYDATGRSEMAVIERGKLRNARCR